MSDFGQYTTNISAKLNLIISAKIYDLFTNNVSPRQEFLFRFVLETGNVLRNDNVVIHTS